APAQSASLSDHAAAPAAAMRGPLAPFKIDTSSPSGLSPAASGDWSMEGQNPGRTRAVANSLSLPLTHQRLVAMPRDNETGSPPVIAKGLMLVETKDHLRAFDLRSGRERWSFDQPGSYISPAIAGDQVFIRAEAGNKGELIALSLDSGLPAWRFSPKRLSSADNNYFGGHLTSPVIADGTVFVGAGKELYALDAASGALRWEFATQNYVTSSATVADGRVFISDFDYIYAIDQNSSALLWTYPAKDAISFSAVATDRAVMVTSGSAVLALDAATGQPLWEHSVMGEKLIPAGAIGDVAFVKSTETLYALNLADGKENWRYHNINFVSLPALAGEQVFVVSGIGADSAVLALNASSGESMWEQRIRSLASTAPIIAGGALYVRMEDGRVLGLWS
ncbi:MAG: PQQ-binding-like beta-propeller repeat protein, partial [Chloroflexota bacterium]